MKIKMKKPQTKFEEAFPSLRELRMEGLVENDNTLGYELKDDGEFIQVFDVQRFCIDKQIMKQIFGNLKKYKFKDEFGNPLELCEEIMQFQ